MFEAGDPCKLEVTENQLIPGDLQNSTRDIRLSSVETQKVTAKLLNHKLKGVLCHFAAADVSTVFQNWSFFLPDTPANLPNTEFN